MRLSKSLIILLLIAFAYSSCNRPPELSVIPSIAYENVDFEIVNEGDPLNESNVLTISINVEDGDGDLGLSGDENGAPYHPFSIVVDDNGEPVQFGDDPNDPPFTCLDYIVEDFENTDWNFDGDLNDTLLIRFNEDQFNITVDFFRKVNGVFQEVDIRAQPPGSANAATLCGQSFDGRFPCLSSEEDPCDYIRSTNRPIKGTINYDMESALFLPIFRTDTMMLKIQIKDRALNESNIVETPEFTLQGLQAN